MGVGDARQLLDVDTQLLGPERAVETHAERLGMADSVPERGGGLAGQRASARVGDGAGDHHWPAPAMLREQLEQRVDRRLGIKRVEDGLDQQQVAAALDQARSRLAVGGDQLVEGDVALARVVDVGRDRRGAVGRAERAGHQPWPVRGGTRRRVGRLAGELRRGAVHFVHDRLEAVVGLRDRVGIEGVGLDDVGAGRQVVRVDVADDLRLGQHQQVVVALEIRRMVGEARTAVARLVQVVALDHGAHRAVDDEDATGEEIGR